MEEPKIKTIKKHIPFIRGEIFVPAKSETRHKVFISKNYIIRFHDDNPNLLFREADFLKGLNHLLIPKVLWKGKMGNLAFMVENRLSGKNMDKVWKKLPLAYKNNIIRELVGFLKYLRTLKRKNFYSVSTGKKYKNFYDLMTFNIKKKISRINKFKPVKELLKEIVSEINNQRIKSLFLKKRKITVVHGDLIIHNLLTDGKNLAGVLDWEFAMCGDPDYDLFRLLYYQECAKAYLEQDIDKIFEAEFLDLLLKKIKKSNLVKNWSLFQKKYTFIRAIFYLNALYWATNSDNPERNFDELKKLWKKMGLSPNIYVKM